MKDYTDFIWEENYKINRRKYKMDHGKKWRFLFINSYLLQDWNHSLNEERHNIQSEQDSCINDWKFLND